VEEYCSLTILSQPGEVQSDFNKRLIAFWTVMLRSRLNDYERVYAEATAVRTHGDRFGRDYLLEATAVDCVEAELIVAGLEYSPADRADLYTKYEATPPDWFQIDH